MHGPPTFAKKMVTIYFEQGTKVESGSFGLRNQLAVEGVYKIFVFRGPFDTVKWVLLAKRNFFVSRTRGEWT